MSEEETPPDLDEHSTNLEPEEEPSWRVKREWIARCTMCDPDGYRINGTICHHVPDQADINRRGIAKCRAVLGPRKPQQKCSRDLVDVIQQQRELGPPQPLSDEQEPEL